MPLYVFRILFIDVMLKNGTAFFTEGLVTETMGGMFSMDLLKMMNSYVYHYNYYYDNGEKAPLVVKGVVRDFRAEHYANIHNLDYHLYRQYKFEEDMDMMDIVTSVPMDRPKVQFTWTSEQLKALSNFKVMVEEDGMPVGRKFMSENIPNGHILNVM